MSSALIQMTINRNPTHIFSLEMPEVGVKNHRSHNYLTCGLCVFMRIVVCLCNFKGLNSMSTFIGRSESTSTLKPFVENNID